MIATAACLILRAPLALFQRGRSGRAARMNVVASIVTPEFGLRQATLGIEKSCGGSEGAVEAPSDC
jgi:hypothetical protein